MENQSYNFAECINKKSPGNQRNDFLVLFNKSITKPLTFVSAYLNAANAITKSIPGIKINPLHDRLALPLLNLYANALEFSLKYYIEATENHRRTKLCNTLNPPPDRFENILYSSHDLSKLVDIAAAMQPSNSTLHKIEQFDQIKHFINCMNLAGISSESTRYLHDRKKEPFPLYNSQTWIYPHQLHMQVSSICITLLDTVLGEEFQLCNLGKLTKKRENELQYSFSQMASLCTLFTAFCESHSDIGTHSIVDISAIFEMPLQLKANESLYVALQNLDIEPLAALCMGLYFSRSALQVEDLDFYRSWSKETLIMKILERASEYKLAFNELETHINNITDLRKKRGFTS
jgi:hypothetical protein